MQRLRSLALALCVGGILSLFLSWWMHAILVFSLLIGGGLALAIFAVVATGPNPRDAETDAAWRAAAPDLPPVSDRARLERIQAAAPRADGAHPKAARRDSTPGR
jgi:hypothetical protein